MNFTREQIKKFELKASEYESENDLLVGLKAISIVNGSWSVIEYEGLKGKKDPITGVLFSDNFPYTLYQKLILKIKDLDKKRAYAKKMQAEHYEQQALSLGIK